MRGRERTPKPRKLWWRGRWYQGGIVKGYAFVCTDAPYSKAVPAFTVEDKERSR
jgi:hypothetical protein